MNCVLNWYDPEDPDQGTNSGFEIFSNKKDMLNWLNIKAKTSPKIEARAFEVQKELTLKAEQVIVRYIAD